jgi:dienelactone hydrolase
LALRSILLAVAVSLAGVSQAAAEISIEHKAFAPAALPSAATVNGWKATFSAETFTAPDGTGIPYRLHRPAARGRLPVVLVLHGSGAIGADNLGQMGAFAAAWADPGHAKDRPAIIVVPQAPMRTANYEAGDDGQLASKAGPPLTTILALMDHLARDPGVDPSRISVVGFSMGASAAMQAVLARPNLFSAAVAFSAVPPPRSAAQRMPPIPLLLVHGDRDGENAIEPDLAWASALSRASARGRMVVYRGMDHRVPDDMLTSWDWRAWMLSQRR